MSSRSKNDKAQRVPVAMDDPVFLPTQPCSATAPVTVSPAGLDCSLELWVGPDTSTKLATSGLIPFVSTGAVQPVALPIAMPAVDGVILHVYVDLYIEGYYFLGYIATEDVILPAGTIGTITWD